MNKIKGKKVQLHKSIEQLKPFAADKYIDILIIQGRISNRKFQKSSKMN